MAWEFRYVDADQVTQDERFGPAKVTLAILDGAVDARAKHERLRNCLDCQTGPLAELSESPRKF